MRLPHVTRNTEHVFAAALAPQAIASAPGPAGGPIVIRASAPARKPESVGPFPFWRGMGVVGRGAEGVSEVQMAYVFSK